MVASVAEIPAEAAGASAGLPFVELVNGLPATTGPYQPATLLEMVLRDEQRRGRVIRATSGSYAIVRDAFPPDQLAALRQMVRP